jgi:hypothetical protein
MYKFLLLSHSGFRYVVLFLLVALLAKSLMGWLGRQPFTKADDRLSLFFFISAHLMLTFGLILYFISPKVRFGDGVMADSIARYWTVEHISVNILAIVLFTIARIRSKKMMEATSKHRTLFLFTLGGLILLIASLSAPSGPGIFGMTHF